MTRKTRALFSLCLALCLFPLTGCKKASPSPSATPANSPSPTPAVCATGLSVITSLASSTNAAGEQDGTAQTDSTVVAVTVGTDGVVQTCKIDAAQTKIHFSPKGEITTDPTATKFSTKQELGAAYGMAKASSIGREWNEQADALAAYCVGKTAEEIRGVAVTGEGQAADADLSGSCTIAVSGLTSAVAKAAESAMNLGAIPGDRLGLGIVTHMDNSKNVTGDAQGVAQAYSTYAAVTVDADGRITSCVLDASQANVNFDATGTVVTDLSALVATKNELGAAYGMAKASGIGLEWDEQAAAFAEYCIGKTGDEVRSVAMTESGTAADPDLSSSCTIHIGDFIEAVVKATENAA